MNLVDAIQLVKTQPPEEVSAEQLAELTALLDETPALAAALGGREAVEEYLAAVAAAIEAYEEEPAVELEEATEPAQPPELPEKRRLRRRRHIELAGWLVLIAGVAIVAANVLWPEPWFANDTVADAAEEAKSSEDSVPAEDTTRKKKHRTRRVTKPPRDPNLWRGWRIKTGKGTRFRSEPFWDRSDPTRPTPTRVIFSRGGQITFTRTLAPPADAKSLMLLCSQEQQVPPGRLQVYCDDALIGDEDVPPVDSGRPIYAPLPPGTTGEHTFRVVYLPATNAEQIRWQHISLEDESVDVVAKSGEPDPKKESLRLWLRADAGVRDAGRRRPGEGGFGPVRTWLDQSHNRFHFTSSSPTAGPAFADKSPLGGKPALNIGGQPMTYTGKAIYNSAESTTFAVFNVTGLPRKVYGKSGTVFTTSAPIYKMAYDTMHNRRGIYGHFVHLSAPQQCRSTQTFMSTTNLLVIAQVAGDHSQIEVNFAAEGQGAQTGGPSGTTFTINTSHHLAELMIYNRALSDTEVHQISDYLGAKYGIVPKK